MAGSDETESLNGILNSLDLEAPETKRNLAAVQGELGRLTIDSAEADIRGETSRLGNLDLGRDASSGNDAEMPDASPLEQKTPAKGKEKQRDAFTGASEADSRELPSHLSGLKLRDLISSNNNEGRSATSLSMGSSGSHGEPTSSLRQRTQAPEPSGSTSSARHSNGSSSASPSISRPTQITPPLSSTTLSQSRTQLPLLSLPAHNPPNISALSYFLGLVSGLGIGLVLASLLGQDMEGYGPIGMWLVVLGAFHEGEYLGAATWRPSEVGINSFLINHSPAYHAAAAMAVAEYFLEWWLFPSWKQWSTLSWIGLGITVAALSLRNLAVHTLGEHFSHQLSYRPPSKLITHGIYDTLRHPSYTGFYYYSVGTQLLLLNPICAAGYAFVLSRFFRDRIEEEESRLQAVEGWSSYRKRTGVYIPGVD